MTAGQVWEHPNGFRVTLREPWERSWWIVDTDVGERFIGPSVWAMLGFRRVA